MPDVSDKDQHSKINDSVHPSVLSSSQNHAMPVKHNVFLLNLRDVEEVPSHDGETDIFSSGLDEKGKKEYVPLRTAYSQACRCGMQPKAKHSLRAQARQIQTKTIGLLRERKKKDRGARAGVTMNTSSKLIC
ncbi:hypothetical protein TNCV_333341 [Trichonephila clavipes]|nr:hypothetical protein TNCV_333341 [Trichonephila clavipes]